MSPGRPRVWLAGLALAKLGAASGPVTEPAPTSTLKMPILGTREKPLVALSHRRHGEQKIACVRCHHVNQGRRNL